MKIRAELQDMVQQNETKIAMVDSRMEGQIVRFVLMWSVHLRLTRIIPGLQNITVNPMSNSQQKLGYSSQKPKLNVNPIETLR